MAFATALRLLGSAPLGRNSPTARRIHQGGWPHDGDPICLSAPLAICEGLTSSGATDHLRRSGATGELAELRVQEKDGSAEART